MTHFALSKTDKINLLKIARNSLNSLFNSVSNIETKPVEQSPILNEPCGAFVSLYYRNDLKGCIGSFESKKPLMESIAELTISAAINDSRFTPVKQNEVDEIKIEISVLSPMEKINDPDDIELGKHGIFIKQGFQRGTFLPQVADKTKWSKEEFISHCSRDKAGIGWNGWKSAELFRYEAIIMNESEFTEQ